MKFTQLVSFAPGRVVRSRDDRRESTEASPAQQSRSEMALTSIGIADEGKIKAARFRFDPDPAAKFRDFRYALS